MTPASLAVLPFANMSPDPADTYFSDGITEEIINALAGIEGLKVTSRTSSFYFKDKQLPLTEIADQLGVSYVLEGSVRRAGNTLRIRAQLIHAQEDSHFWSETWDRDYGDLFSVQDEISLLIAERLREQIGHFEIQDHLIESRTDNLAAHDLSLKARYHFTQWNPEEIRKALRLYEQALALDAQHIDSLVGLADAYGFMATTEFMPRMEAWNLASAYTQKALALDPTHAGALYQLANIALFVEMDYQAALKHTQLALSHKPGHAEARWFLSFLYLIAGELELAHEHLQQALAVDPLSSESRFYEAYYYYTKGETAIALEKMEQCLAENPFNLPAYVLRAYCLLVQKRWQETRTFMANMPREIRVDGDQLGLTCLAHTMEGSVEAAQASFEELKAEAENPSAFQAHAYLFLVYGYQKEWDKAFEWLEQGIKWKSTVLYINFKSPLSLPLQADARFQQYYDRLFPTADQPMPVQPSTALLDEATTQAYTQRLLDFLEAERPFLNPALTLRLLAEQIEIHPNQLSWLLNTSLGQNFSEFINRHRIDTFKTLALDPANAHISLLGLAYESGFHSKSVFNTHFKRMEGMTPSEFVRRNKN